MQSIIKLDGYVSNRETKVLVEIAGQRYELGTVQSLDASYNISSEDVNSLGDNITKHFVTTASIEGSLSLKINHRVWTDLALYHMRYKTLPPITIMASLADKFGYSNSGETVPQQTDGKRDEKKNYGKKEVIFRGVIFDSLPLIQGSNSDSDQFYTHDFNFTANSVDVVEDFQGTSTILTGGA